MSGGIDVDVWKGLDRRSFHANAVLLELKCRGQGPTLRRPQAAEQIFPVPELEAQRTLQRMAKDVLDDVALVAAASGGKDNVSAVCLEAGEDDRCVIFRVASNDARPEEHVSRLLELLLLPQAPDSGAGHNGGRETDEPRADVLSHLLSVCEQRVRKHSDRMSNELRHAGIGPSSSQLRTPQYQEHGDKTESRQDMRRLGAPSSATYDQYVRLARARFREIERLAQALAVKSRAGFDQTNQRHHQMVALVKTAYLVRRSASFRQLLECNITVTKRADARAAFRMALTERLGKLSRFYRAALTLTLFGEYLVREGMQATAQCVETGRIQVPELEGETVTELRLRGGGGGGGELSRLSDQQLAGMLRRWRQYRLHAEMQLVVYYEAHASRRRLLSRYIGCDKLCCFLCHTFIEEHGRFDVSGCHQSLYSLWTLPRSVHFVSRERAKKFKSALRLVCTVLDTKVRQLRDAPASQSLSRYANQNESVAHLSRVSLAGSLLNTPAAAAAAVHETVLQPDQQPHDSSFGSDSEFGQHSEFDTCLPILEEEEEVEEEAAVQEPAALQPQKDISGATVRRGPDETEDDDDDRLSGPRRSSSVEPAASRGDHSHVHLETNHAAAQRQQQQQQQPHELTERDDQYRVLEPHSNAAELTSVLAPFSFEDRHPPGTSSHLADEDKEAHRTDPDPDPGDGDGDAKVRTEGVVLHPARRHGHNLNPRTRQRHRRRREVQRRRRRHGPRQGDGQSWTWSRSRSGRARRFKSSVTATAIATGILTRAWKNMVRRLRRWVVENVVEVYG